MPAHKPDRLIQCHQRKYDADRTGCARPDPADKICVCRIIDIRDQHTDNRRKCQCCDQFGNRRFCHPAVFFCGIV